MIQTVYQMVQMPLCAKLLLDDIFIVWLWNKDWSTQIQQAKNWKTTNFGNKKQLAVWYKIRVGSLFIEQLCFFCTWLQTVFA